MFHGSPAALQNIHGLLVSKEQMSRTVSPVCSLLVADEEEEEGALADSHLVIQPWKTRHLLY